MIENDMGLLVVGSDERALSHICAQLEADGYRADRARRASDASVKARARPPAAMILGELAPPEHSIGLLREIREGDPAETAFSSTVPVIVRSADGGRLALLRAFDAGCDDFVSERAPYLELRARLRALLRRVWLRTAAAKRIGPLVIDPLARRVHYAGREIGLSRLEFDLLNHFAAHPGRVLSKHELLRDVWGYRSQGRTRTVDTHVCRLRKKLADASGHGHIVNVPGLGYRLTAPAVAPAAVVPLRAA